MHDFTAVGDVVNTASRLQGQAAGGEVVLSARLARLLPSPVGVPEQVVLKGKQEPCDIRRVQWFSDRPEPAVRRSLLRSRPHVAALVTKIGPHSRGPAVTKQDPASPVARCTVSEVQRLTLTE